MLAGLLYELLEDLPAVLSSHHSAVQSNPQRLLRYITGKRQYVPVFLKLTSCP